LKTQTFKLGPQRIVSLIPSSTELLWALGLGSQVVGISHECDFPNEAVGLPICTEANLDPRAHGKEIDRNVRELLSRSLSIYKVRTDLLERLKPDLIVTQDQCQVCAVSLKDVEAAVSKLTFKEVSVCSLLPHCLQDVFRDFRRVGEATGTQTRAESLVTAFEERLSKIREKTRGLPVPRVVCIEWLDPPMIGGGWIPELVKIAGGEPLIVPDPTRFRQVDWELIHRENPDIVVIFTSGYGLEKTLADLKTSAAAANLRKLTAAQRGKMFVCDGNAFFNRPGPRLADSCEILASLFHPSVFGDLLSKYRKHFLSWS
jgi:iron complex transport system substrate-binding protein